MYHFFYFQFDFLKLFYIIKFMAEYIQLDQLKPGMITAEPIRNSFGSVMIPDNFEIEEKHIGILRKWSLEGILIQSAGGEGPKEFTPEQFEEAKAYIKSKMKWAPELPIESDLFTTAVNYRLENAG